MKKPASPQALSRVNRIASGTLAKNANIAKAAKQKLKDIPKPPPEPVPIKTKLIPVQEAVAGSVLVQTLLAQCGTMPMSNLGY